MIPSAAPKFNVNSQRWLTVKKQERGTKIRIIGTRLEIEAALAAFSYRDFVWESNEYFYPKIDQPNFYSYYVENFEYAPHLKK